MGKQKFRIHTNKTVFRSIAEDHYKEMKFHLERNIRGRIVTADPEQKSFKAAMISVVFYCMWLEEELCFQIVNKTKIYTKEYNKKHDRLTYEEKLRFLGLKDEDIIQSVENLRNLRNSLVHEKAIPGAMKKPNPLQPQVEEVHQLMIRIEQFFKELQHTNQ